MQRHDSTAGAAPADVTSELAREFSRTQLTRALFSRWRQSELWEMGVRSTVGSFHLTPLSPLGAEGAAQLNPWLTKSPPHTFLLFY